MPEMTVPKHEGAKVVPLFGMAADTLDDDELAMRARHGDRSAFDRLVLRHQEVSLAVAARYLGDVALAHDAVQAAFLEVFRGLSRYEPRGRLVHWLRTVVLNQARMIGRSARIRERQIDSYGAEHHVELAGPEEWVAARQRRAAIDGSLAKLSDKLREVVVLRYVAGHSLGEIAQMLDLPVGTVKSRLFAAMMALKEDLGAQP